MTFRLYFISLILFLLLFFETGRADEFIVFSAIPTEWKHYAILAYTTTFKTKTGRYNIAPGIEIDYGACKGLELDLTLTYAFYHPYTPDTPDAHGVGDTFVSMTYTLLPETKHNPHISFAPYVLIPTGDARRGLGNGRPMYFLPVVFEKTFDKWTLKTNLGYVHNEAPFTKDYHFEGVRVDNKVNEKLFLGLELYNQDETMERTPEDPAQNSTMPIEQNPFFSGKYTLINFGGDYKIGKDLYVMLSAGRSIAGERVTIGYLGLYYGPINTAPKSSESKEKKDEYTRPNSELKLTS